MSALPPRKPTAIDELTLALRHTGRAVVAHGALDLDEVHRHLLTAHRELTIALRLLEAKAFAQRGASLEATEPGAAE